MSTVAYYWDNTKLEFVAATSPATKAVVEIICNLQLVLGESLMFPDAGLPAEQMIEYPFLQPLIIKDYVSTFSDFFSQIDYVFSSEGYIIAINFYLLDDTVPFLNASFKPLTTYSGSENVNNHTWKTTSVKSRGLQQDQGVGTTTITTNFFNTRII